MYWMYVYKKKDVQNKNRSRHCCTKNVVCKKTWRRDAKGRRIESFVQIPGRNRDINSTFTTIPPPPAEKKGMYQMEMPMYGSTQSGLT